MYYHLNHARSGSDPYFLGHRTGCAIITATRKYYEKAGDAKVDWKPIRQGHTPVYKQIAEWMEQRIASGEFPPGSRLPSERLLAKELQVNRSTVVTAYEELRAAGLVERRHGSGTIVSRDIWGLARNRTPDWKRMAEAGLFRPNLPLIRQIRRDTQDSDMLDLASGELSPELVPHEQFRRLLAAGDFPCHFGYEHPQGNPQLRDTLVAHMKTWKGIDAAPSSILVTAGAQQALHLVVQCLLQPGDAVAIEDPSYCYSLPLFRSAGVRLFPLPVDSEGIDPDELLALHGKHRIKMVFLNPNFQNPTGTFLSLPRRKRLLEISAEHGIPIVEDDPYSLTAFSGEHVPTLKSLDRHGTVLYISSLTKIVASGLRIGWVVGPRTVIERLADAKQQIDFGHSIFPQWLANRFLSSEWFPAHLDMLRRELAGRSERLVCSLRESFGGSAEFVPPAGGIHLWCRLTGEWSENRMLAESVKRGVIFVPGMVFGSKKGFVRFTFGRPPKERIQDAISRLAEAYRSVCRQ